ncbi:hypothetical protein [Sulfuricurvum sp.]|uniref:hypothetical protein n=1 Tax=Sulfuricurvum sp. TaxID=2025608 RepID=UPI002D2DC3FB|nr:hypothetical protein [Sulfuricurvum sp.]HZF70097.1 hypothetical protein [Sulfuricurvum sp.]
MKKSDKIKSWLTTIYSHEIRKKSVYINKHMKHDLSIFIDIHSKLLYSKTIKLLEQNHSNEWVKKIITHDIFTVIQGTSLASFAFEISTVIMEKAVIKVNKKKSETQVDNGCWKTFFHSKQFRKIYKHQKLLGKFFSNLFK